MAEIVFGKVGSREPAMLYIAHESLHVLNISTILFLTHVDHLSLGMLIEVVFWRLNSKKYLELIVIYFELFLWQYSGTTTSCQWVKELVSFG